VKKREATQAARQSGTIGLAGRAPLSEAWGITPGSNRLVLGPRPQRVAEGGGNQVEEMADVDKKEEEAAGEAQDVMVAESKTETATRTVTDTETGISVGAWATDY
jgi:hypothetical protein